MSNNTFNPNLLQSFRNIFWSKCIRLHFWKTLAEWGTRFQACLSPGAVSEQSLHSLSSQLLENVPLCKTSPGYTISLCKSCLLSLVTGRIVLHFHQYFKTTKPVWYISTIKPEKVSSSFRVSWQNVLCWFDSKAPLDRLLQTKLQNRLNYLKGDSAIS